MAGRKPKPTAIKKLQGNPGKRPLNKAEPQPKKECPDIPSHLDLEAIAEWERIVPELLILGILTRIDRAALAAYCMAYSRWVKAEKLIAEKGTLYKTKSGNIMTSPALWVANKAMEQMHKFLTEFGMTPSSRSRIKVSVKIAEDPYEDFRNRLK